MNHKRNLIAICFLSFALSLTLLFINQDLVQVSIADKVMEVVIMMALFLIIFMVIYFFIAMTKRGASKVIRRQKKDLQ
ncbi:hypothetical protein GV828_09730 [Flavobacterium sp. NST-5]|uniref:CcmD family protein n=1 Tax=Flavobacterium ichthyis TaxID=2698827 RepID=A0ABW9Z9C5_9FLAO|nr:hypothetical protein [Flavobacterium ichthyis]NBL65478.1 hypothetical protein [Flavobacterium ichthyis]